MAVSAHIFWPGHSVDELDWQEINHRMIDHGYCIIDAPDDSRQRLVDFTKACGTILRHERSEPEDGVAEVVSKGGGENHMFRALDPNVFPPHTDGAYLQTYYYSDGYLKYIGPPSTIMLQCVTPATTGGQTILIDGSVMIEKMLAFDPELLIELEQPAYVIARNKNKATNVPILCSSPDRKRWYFRYREDVLACPHLTNSLERFTDRYINNPDCWTAEFRLEKNQILVVDNHRMLHMRRSFQIAEGQPPRLLRRTWIHNDQWSSDIKLKSTSQHDAFEDSQGYTPVDHHVSNRLVYAPGIRKSDFRNLLRTWSGSSLERSATLESATDESGSFGQAPSTSRWINEIRSSREYDTEDEI